MPSFPLAADVDQGTIAKFIIFGVAGLIWLLNSLATWIAKQKEEEARRRVREALDKSPRQPPPTDRVEPARSVPPRLPPLPPSVADQGRTRRKQRAAPSRPPIEPAPAIARASQPAAPMAPAAAVAAKPSSANAATIAAWMRPATLRQQFILTEILQPPVALRESHLAS